MSRPPVALRALLVTGAFVACTVGGLVVAASPAGHGGIGSRGLGVAGGSGATAEAGRVGGSLDSTPSTRGADAPDEPSATTTTAVPTTVDVGALDQTDDRPTTTSALFTAGAGALWQAIVTDDPDVALGFFFPRAAYRQVKDIGDPDGDYDGRLIANFRTDVHDLHARLGAGADRAELVGLEVPDAQAQWIEPGVEYNKGSYWRVLGSTLRYRLDGAEHTLPVESLISWRGEWYVVHLGPIR